VLKPIPSKGEPTKKAKPKEAFVYGFKAALHKNSIADFFFGDLWAFTGYPRSKAEKVYDAALSS